MVGLTIGEEPKATPRARIFFLVDKEGHNYILVKEGNDLRVVVTTLPPAYDASIPGKTAPIEELVPVIREMCDTHGIDLPSDIEVLHRMKFSDRNIHFCLDVW